MNDSTLSRPMFQRTPAMSAPSMPATGIGGMTTPDQNAMALRNMFSPQAFKRGGEVIDGVAHFAEGDEVVAPTTLGGQPAPPPAPAGQEVPDRIARELLGARSTSPAAPPTTSNVPVQRGIEASEAGQRAMAKISAGRTGRNPSLVQEGFADLQRITDEAYAKANIPAASPEESFRRVTSGFDTNTPESLARMEDKDRLDQTVPGGMFSRSVAFPSAPAPATPPPSPKDESIQTNLAAIRARREEGEAALKARKEQSDKQREENKWMGILAAGLGMMSSKSPRFAGGVGEGGLQGLQTFAGLEKGRRDDEAARRQEDYQRQQLSLQTQQLSQQKEIAFAQLAKDPDAVRTYAALGGWKAGDPPEKYQQAALDGYEKTHAAERMRTLNDYVKQAAVTGADPESVKRANAELLRLGLGNNSQFKLLGAKP